MYDAGDEAVGLEDGLGAVRPWDALSHIGMVVEKQRAFNALLNWQIDTLRLKIMLDQRIRRERLLRLLRLCG